MKVLANTFNQNNLFWSTWKKMFLKVMRITVYAVYEYNNSLWIPLCQYSLVLCHICCERPKVIDSFALLMKPFDERTFDSVLECVSLAVKLHKEKHKQLMLIQICGSGTQRLCPPTPSLSLVFN